MLRQAVSLRVWLSLLPIVGGVALASATEASFNWAGFVAAMGSNLTFQSRNVLSKKFMQGMDQGGEKLDNINLFSVITMMSAVLLLPVALSLEGFQFAPSNLQAMGLDPRSEKPGDYAKAEARLLEGLDRHQLRRLYRQLCRLRRRLRRGLRGCACVAVECRPGLGQQARCELSGSRAAGPQYRRAACVVGRCKIRYCRASPCYTVPTPQAQNFLQNPCFSILRLKNNFAL